MKLPFTKPTFESITGGLQSTIEQLDNLAEKNDTEVGDNNVAIKALQDNNKRLENEAARSSATADKLRDLIGDAR